MTFVKKTVSGNERNSIQRSFVVHLINRIYYVTTYEQRNSEWERGRESERKAGKKKEEGTTGITRRDISELGSTGVYLFDASTLGRAGKNRGG